MASGGEIFLLNSNNARLLLNKCGFMAVTHWQRLMSELGVTLDNRRRLDMMAKINQDFENALEEGLDLWLRDNPDAKWDELISKVEVMEMITADRMREALFNEKTSPSCLSYPRHNACVVESAVSIMQKHVHQLCKDIKDPTAIASRLYELKVIDNTQYQAAISSRSLHVKDLSIQTVQLLNTVYQTAISRCRVDVIDIFIMILEEMQPFQPIAAKLRYEFDDVFRRFTTGCEPPRQDNYPMDSLMSPHHATTPILSTTPTDQSEDFIDVMLALNTEQKFDQMRMKFGILLQKLCNRLPCTVSNLKDLLILSFCDLEEYIEPCNTSVSVLRVLQKSNYCSFTNCAVVELLVQQFELEDIRRDLNVYLDEREKYYKTIQMEEFVLEAKKSIGCNRRVVFLLNWTKKDEKSLAEFEQMLRAVFDCAAKYIKLKAVKRGSLIVECECPEFIAGCLMTIVKQKEGLLFCYGVLKVTIGDIVLMDRISKASDNSSNRKRNKSSTSNTSSQKASSSRKTSAASQDIDFVPSLSSVSHVHSSPLFSPHEPHPPAPLSIPPQKPHPSAPLPIPSREPRPPAVPLESHPLRKKLSLPAAYRTISDAASTRPPYPLPVARRSSSVSTPSLVIEPDFTRRSNLPQRTMSDLSTRPYCIGSTRSSASSTQSLPLTGVTDLSPPDLFGSNYISPSTSPRQSSLFPDPDTDYESQYVVFGSRLDPLQKYSWFWGNISKETISKELSNMPEGTFLVQRGDTSRLPKYTISFRHHGNTKSLSVILVNEKFIIKGHQTSEGMFESLPSLVNYYTHNPLVLYDGKETIALKHPMVKFAESVDGDAPPVRQLLKELQQISDNFDSENSKFELKLSQKLDVKKNLDELNSDIDGLQNTSEMLKENLLQLNKNFKTRSFDASSLDKIRICYKTIKTKIESLEKQLSSTISLQYTVQNQYRTLEMACSKSHSELSSLQQQKDDLTRKLVDTGMTTDEINGMVKMNLFSEMENTFVTFYRKHTDIEESFTSDVYDYIVLGETRHMGTVRHLKHKYEYPRWRPRIKEPFYDRISSNDNVTLLQEQQQLTDSVSSSGLRQQDSGFNEAVKQDKPTSHQQPISPTQPAPATPDTTIPTELPSSQEFELDIKSITMHSRQLAKAIQEHKVNEYHPISLNISSAIGKMVAKFPDSKFIPQELANSINELLEAALELKTSCHISPVSAKDPAHYTDLVKSNIHKVVKATRNVLTSLQE